MSKVYKTYYNSPIGIIEIKATEEGITSIIFVEEEGQRDETPILRDCCAQLDEYFEGKRKNFDLNIVMEGTDFQRRVWNALRTVEYGRTASYKDIAEQIGNVKAVRAVGMTNSKNPISIVVPCHRVIGSNGKLTGYAGGLWRKEWLLNHEKSFNVIE